MKQSIYRHWALLSYYRMLNTKRIELAMQGLLGNQISLCIETRGELRTIDISWYEVFFGMKMLANRTKMSAPAEVI